MLPHNLTQEQVLEAVQRDDNSGFCVICGFEHCGGCEPDMRKGHCDQCGGNGVYGAEELLIQTVL